MKSRNHLGHRISIHRAENSEAVEINPSPNIRCSQRIRNRIRFRCSSQPQSSCEINSERGRANGRAKSEAGSLAPRRAMEIKRQRKNDLIGLCAIYRKTQKAQQSFCQRNSILISHHSDSVQHSMLICSSPLSSLRLLHSLQLQIN